MKILQSKWDGLGGGGRGGEVVGWFPDVEHLLTLHASGKLKVKI